MKLTLDEFKNKNDVIIESSGVTVIYDSSIEKYVYNSVIDYSNSWFERGFVIRGIRTSSC